MIKELKGRFSFLISDRGADVELIDDSSGCIVLRMKLNTDEVCALIARRSDLPVTVQYIGHEMIGKIREIKTVKLDGYFRDKDKVKLYTMIHPYLIDGWRVYNDGLKTQQNERGKHAVTLIRYLERNENHD